MIAGADPRIAVVGLGYVGLPLAVALADQFETIGFDIDPGRIAELRAGRDRTREVDGPRLEASPLRFTSDPDKARGCDVFIVTVPTPVDANRLPDLRPVIGATRTVAGLIEPGRETIIVYESTVYPGVTEDLCGPELERLSGLKRGKDFFLGYSPERINPGDKEHTVERIMKVVAGENPQVTARLADIYGRITIGGTFRAASIKVAEAGKVIENAQRDINIAFMNEITQIFSKLDISIWDVLDAAGTKWNFLKFQPGLVGGHCIGVDPYYLSYRAQQLGHLPDVILSGRMTNDAMGEWVADKLHARCDGRCGEVLVMGLTFKEDVPDLRNSKVIDVIRRLDALGHRITVHDPLADPYAAMEEYGLTMEPDALDRRYDLVLVAVPHARYKAMTPKQVAALAVDGGLVADLKGIWRHQAFPKRVERWSL
ncbi:MAG: nucleotide sugar dehydrogenase [Sphingomonadaceae bacterium]|nr:nucleotide sugar dehydrogenase [Sphingomonadaceae bacterium]